MKFVLLVVVVAVVVYLLVRLVERRISRRRGSGGGGGGRPGSSPAWPGPRRTPPSRPLGPDDDPDFLRDLNRRQKRRQDPDSH